MTTISRRDKADERKKQILTAAFNEFTKKGFAMTSMDDIAKKAAVSKGLIYHYFDSKESLLEALVQTHIVVLLPKHIPSFPEKGKAKDFIFNMFSTIIREALKGDGGKLFYLIMTEGERFPKVSEMYYKTVVSPVMHKMKKLLTIAWEKGELKNKAIIDTPQILAGPLITSLIWSKLFDRYHKLDFEVMLKNHLDNIFNN